MDGIQVGVDQVDEIQVGVDQVDEIQVGVDQVDEIQADGVLQGEVQLDDEKGEPIRLNISIKDAILSRFLDVSKKSLLIIKLHDRVLGVIFLDL